MQRSSVTQITQPLETVSICMETNNDNEAVNNFGQYNVLENKNQRNIQNRNENKMSLNKEDLLDIQSEEVQNMIAE